MLKLQNLSKTYGKGEVKAVDNVSLEIRPGEIFGFLGPNGAGKTTTIKMIVGLLKPDSGKVFLDNIDVWEKPLESKSKISFVPDTPQVYDKLKGIEYLNFIADIYNIPEDIRQERIEKYLDIFNLKNAVGDVIGSYSHGMRQKLVLISALIHY